MINAPPILLKNLSKNIKYERVRMDLSQRKLAEMLNLKGSSTVTHWERGNGYPTLETFLILCNFFNRTPGDMFADSLPSPPPNENKHTEVVGESNPLIAVKNNKEEAEQPPPLPQNKGDNKEDIKLLRQTALDILNKIELMSH